MIFAWLLHAFFATVIAYLLSLTFGSLTLTIAILSLIFGTLIGRASAKALEVNKKEFKFLNFAQGQAGLVESVIFTFILYAAWRHFLWMLYPAGHALATLSANNFGDLPLHVNFIRAFAGGVHFPPVNPIFTSESLRYPLGSDLYNALWEIVGVRLQAHLFLTGLLATVASLIFLRAYAGWWGIGAFFLNGGVAAWSMFSGAMIEDFQKSIDWKNFFLSVFITQRGMLFALPLGLLLLIRARDHFSRVKVLNKKQLAILGLIWGFLPLFHLHAFVIISLFLVGIAYEQQNFRGVVAFLKSRMALFAYIPAILLVLHSTGFLKATSVLHYSPGWMAKPDQFLPFMWLNFGPWLFLPIAILIALFFPANRAKRKALLVEWCVYMTSFIIFFNVMLAPWEWDNIKILIWPYLGFARMAFVVFEPHLGVTEKGRAFGAFARPAISVVLFLSGFVSILWSLQDPGLRKADIYQIGDLANAQGALKKVPRDAIFASSTTHVHPLTYFGRLRVHGYEGHLWSHGIDAKEVWSKLEPIMKGTESAEDSIRLAKELGVTYIYWGHDEKTSFGPETKPWMSVLENVSDVPDVAIYKIK